MPEFTPRTPNSNSAFTARPGQGGIDSTFGELGGIFGAPAPWTFGGQIRGFDPRTHTVGTYTPRMA